MNGVNYFKKTYRIINKFLLIFFAKILAQPLKPLGLMILPSYDKIKNFKFNYSKLSRRLIFYPKKEESFNKIYIDNSLNYSFLCKIGSTKYPTAKSPYAEWHRCGYTGLYNLLFSSFRDKKINFAEIGVETNDSIKMWREFFSQATIHAFEFFDEKIERAKEDSLKNTFYHKIDVRNEEDIIKSFKKTNSKFDIIIDDSTHEFEDQINIITHCNQFLEQNGILIIEDIYKKGGNHFRKEYSEANYYEALKKIKNLFHDIVFVETKHINNYSSNYKFEKILILIKK